MQTQVPNEIKAAVNYVRELGMKDGKEHLAAVDAKGEILFIEHGNENQVDATGHDFKNVKFVVHNHPNDSSLSPQDLAMATLQGVTVAAVTHKGSVFMSKGALTPKLDSLIPKERRVGALSQMMEEAEKMDNLDALHNATMRIGGDVVARYKQRTLKEDPDHLVCHFVNVLFANAGVIDYTYSLSPEEETMFRNYNDFYNERVNGQISLT